VFICPVLPAAVFFRNETPADGEGILYIDNDEVDKPMPRSASWFFRQAYYE
jgi:hypothetical protein